MVTTEVGVLYPSRLVRPGKEVFSLSCFYLLLRMNDLRDCNCRGVRNLNVSCHLNVLASIRIVLEE